MFARKARVISRIRQNLAPKKCCNHFRQSLLPQQVFFYQGEKNAPNFGTLRTEKQNEAAEASTEAEAKAESEATADS